MHRITCYLLGLTTCLALTQSALAGFALIDDFDGHDIGDLDGQGGWEASILFEIDVDPSDPSNRVLSVLDGSTSEAIRVLENPLEDGTTGTLFFRFRTNDFASHVNWGLSDVEFPTEWNDFEAQIRDERDNSERLDFRDGGGFTQTDVTLEPDEWFSIWMVIDNDDDITMNYIQSETTFPEQTRITAGGGVQETYDFRFGTDEPLVTLFVRNGEGHTGEWYLDDVYLDLDGENLSDPTAVGIPGDFNRNGLLDLPDVNLLNGEIAGGGNASDFDLNTDGSIDERDLTVWVKDLKNTWFGDATLDGQFNSSDLVSVFQKDKFEKDEHAGWEDGDWTGDVRFGSSDLVAAFQDGGFERGPRQAAHVPEPGSLILLVLGMSTLYTRRVSIRGKRRCTGSSPVNYSDDARWYPVADDHIRSLP